tara:strand:+ start:1452 stop:1616 length:165 start_codon:yes stop_codon:yes gene_type:complete
LDKFWFALFFSNAFSELYYLVKWIFSCKDILFPPSTNLIYDEVNKLGKVSKEEK